MLAAEDAVEGQAGVGLVRECHARIEVALRVLVGVGGRVYMVVGRVGRGRVRSDVHALALEVRLGVKLLVTHTLRLAGCIHRSPHRRAVLLRSAGGEALVRGT